MKIIALQKNLKQGVFVTSSLTGKNANLPILNNVMIQVVKGEIKLLATDLELGVTNTIRGKIEKEGSFTVDAKILSNYINLLPNQKVELEVREDNLIIESDNYKTKIKGESAEEYPLIPEMAKDFCYEVSIEDFKKTVASIVFAVSNDENRLALSGVLFNIEKGKLFLVGTDSYRLGEKSLVIKNANEEDERRLIVPTKTLQELLRIISGDYGDNRTDKTIKIHLNENQIAFSFDSVEIVSRLIDEQYPDYRQIIPTNFKTTVSAPREELLRAVKAAAIFSKTGINDVVLDFLKDRSEIVVSATSGASGESIINLAAKVTGSDNSITINYKYLLDGLNHIDNDQVSIQIVDANSPCLFKGSEDYVYVVMPIKR